MRMLESMQYFFHTAFTGWKNGMLDNSVQRTFDEDNQEQFFYKACSTELCKEKNKLRIYTSQNEYDKILLHITSIHTHLTNIISLTSVNLYALAILSKSFGCKY